MPGLKIYQQSLIGDIFKYPYYVLKFIVIGIVKILLVPYYAVKFLFKVVKFILTEVTKILLYLLPEFYGENILHSFKAFFCIFVALFVGLTFILLILSPLYFGALYISQRVLDSFDLTEASILLVKIFGTAEGGFLAIAGGGFLLSFGLTFILITVYSPVKEVKEFLEEITSEVIPLSVVLFVSGCVFLVSYLVFHYFVP